MKTWIAAFLFLFCGISHAYSIDDFDKLEGMSIIYAGEFESVTCPIGGEYDCLKWPTNLLKSKYGKEFCIAPVSYVSCSFTCRGLIAASGNNNLSLFIVSKTTGDVKHSRFEQLQCPSIF
jgi:hypothetical protein